MKIIHVSPMYYPTLGGAELHLKEVSEELAARGHEITVLTTNALNPWDLWHGTYGKLPETEMINGVQVVRFHPSGGILASLLGQWVRLRGGYRSLRMMVGKDGMEMLFGRPFLLQLIPYLLRARADIVMTMNWHWASAYHVYLARKLRRFAVVGTPLFHTAENWCHRKIYRRMLADCNAVVVNTPHEAEFVRELGAARVEVAGVGVRPAVFANRNGRQTRERYCLGSAPVVGFVGRQGSNKGLPVLVEAMRTIWQWNPEVRLVVAGHRSLEHPDKNVEDAIQTLDGFERQRLVRISGFAENDKASLYDAFDVLALPSTGESFGIAYLEAWLCRKPVIGARIASTQCVIDEGVDGLLANPEDPLDIARKIIDLLSDSNKRQKMGMMGYLKTKTQYTWQKVTDKLENVYVEVCGDGNATTKVISRALRTELKTLSKK